MISGTTDTQISNCSFSSNYAHEEGGAFKFAEHSGALIEGCSFAENKSPLGGDIIVAKPQDKISPVTVTTSEFRYSGSESLTSHTGSHLVIQASSFLSPAASI